MIKLIVVSHEKLCQKQEGVRSNKLPVSRPLVANPQSLIPNPLPRSQQLHIGIHNGMVFGINGVLNQAFAQFLGSIQGK